MSARHAVLATVLLAGVVVGLRAGSPGDAGTRTEPEPAGRTGGRPAGVPGHARAAIVASITDGDTLRVEIGGANAPVRLLELDTPETAGACGASEATAALARLAPVGSRVWLEADVEDRDRYGRLLRYLWRDDGTMVNDALVRQGWAATGSGASRIPPQTERHPPMAYADGMQLAAPDYVVLIVADLDRAVRFYSEVLGLPLGHRSGPYAQFATGVTRVALYERNAMAATLGVDGLRPPPPDAPAFELGFKVDNVDAAYAQLVNAGAEPATPPRDRPWGQRTAYIRDPDGHLIEFAQTL